MSPSFPATGVVIVEVSRYAVTTQDSLLDPAEAPDDRRQRRRHDRRVERRHQHHEHQRPEDGPDARRGDRPGLCVSARGHARTMSTPPEERDRDRRQHDGTDLRDDQRRTIVDSLRRDARERVGPGGAGRQERRATRAPARTAWSVVPAERAAGSCTASSGRSRVRSSRSSSAAGFHSATTNRCSSIAFRSSTTSLRARRARRRCPAFVSAISRFCAPSSRLRSTSSRNCARKSRDDRYGIPRHSRAALRLLS